RGRLLGRPARLAARHRRGPGQGAARRHEHPDAGQDARRRARNPEGEGDLMSYTVTLIPGDGIGPEVMAAAVRVLSATGVAFEWETEIAGAGAIGEHGTALPPRVLTSILKNKVALKGPTETPIGTGHRSINVELRKQ